MSYIILTEDGEPIEGASVPGAIRQLEAIEEFAADVRRGIRTTDELLDEIERGLFYH